MKVPQSSGNPHHFTLATTSLCRCLIRIMHIHRETATSPDVWPPLWTSLWFTISPGCGHIWCWKWTTSLQESSSAHDSRCCRQATWNPPGRKPVWASSSASALSPKLRCLWWEHPSWSTQPGTAGLFDVHSQHFYIPHGLSYKVTIFCNAWKFLLH